MVSVHTVVLGQIAQCNPCTQCPLMGGVCMRNQVENNSCFYVPDWEGNNLLSKIDPGPNGNDLEHYMMSYMMLHDKEEVSSCNQEGN